MSNTMRIAKTSVRGGFNLFWGLIISNVISAAAVVVIARMLSPEEYGLVKVASTAPSLFTLFRDLGLSAAIVRYIAQYRSENNSQGIKTTILAGLCLMLTIGIALSVACFFLSEYLAVQVFKRPEITHLIRVASIVIFAGALVSTSESVFIGFETMNYRSIVLVSQASLKFLLSPLLVMAGFGVLGSLIGVVSSALLAGFMGFSLLYLRLYNKLPRMVDGDLTISNTGFNMLRYGLPLFISSLVGGALTQFNNFLMAMYCSDQAIGNYSVALNFTVLISFFTQPIASVLFPAFSKLTTEKDSKDLSVIFKQSVRYATLLVIPVATAIMVLSPHAVFTLFGSKYANAPLYLSLLCLSSFYTALGNLSIGNFINSRGRTDLNMKLGLVNAVVGFILSLVLVSRFQILGLIYAGLASTVPGLVLGLWLVRKYWGVTIDLNTGAKTIAVSAFAAMATFAMVNTLMLPHWILLLTGSFLFFVTYITLGPLIGAVSEEDLNNLRELLKEFGSLSNMLSWLIDLMKKLARG